MTARTGRREGPSTSYVHRPSGVVQAGTTVEGLPRASPSQQRLKTLLSTHVIRTDLVSGSLKHGEQLVEFLRRLHVALLESHEFRIHSALVHFEHLHAPALHGSHR